MVRISIKYLFASAATICLAAWLLLLPGVSVASEKISRGVPRSSSLDISIWFNKPALGDTLCPGAEYSFQYCMISNISSSSRKYYVRYDGGVWKFVSYVTIFDTQQRTRCDLTPMDPVFIEPGHSTIQFGIKDYSDQNFIALSVVAPIRASCTTCNFQGPVKLQNCGQPDYGNKILALGPSEALLLGATCIRRSEDGGKIWDITAQLPFLHPRSLGMDEATSRIYAIRARSIHVSSDRGRSWTKQGGMKSSSGEIFLGAVGSNGHIVLITDVMSETYSSVLYSSNGFATAGTSSSIPGKVLSIAYVPGTQQTFIACGLYLDPSQKYLARIWKTTNGGASWFEVYSRTGTGHFGALAFSPSGNTGVAFAADGAEIYGVFTLDRGQTWTPIQSVPVYGSFGDRIRNGGIAFINDRVGYTININRTVFVTTDRGKTWNTCTRFNELIDWSYPSITGAASSTGQGVYIITSDWNLYADYLPISGQKFLKISSPKIGDHYNPGSTIPITWSTDVDSVEIHFSSNNGKDWTFVAKVPGNPGSYSWKAPTLKSDVCRIRLRDARDHSLFSLSDLFSIGTTTHILSIRSSVNGVSVKVTRGQETRTYSLPADITVDHGAAVTVEIDQAPPGYVFSHWLVNGTTTQKIEDLSVLADTRIDAVFQESDHYSVQVESTPSGFPCKASPPDDNNVTNFVTPTTLSYQSNTRISITAGVKDGYYFKHWLLNGVPVSDQTVSLTVTGDVQLQAIFARNSVRIGMLVVEADDMQTDTRGDIITARGNLKIGIADQNTTRWILKFTGNTEAILNKTASSIQLVSWSTARFLPDSPIGSTLASGKSSIAFNPSKGSMYLSGEMGIGSAQNSALNDKVWFDGTIDLVDLSAAGQLNLHNSLFQDIPIVQARVDFSRYLFEFQIGLPEGVGIDIGGFNLGTGAAGLKISLQYKESGKQAVMEIRGGFDASASLAFPDHIGGISMSPLPSASIPTLALRLLMRLGAENRLGRIEVLDDMSMGFGSGIGVTLELAKGSFIDIGDPLFLVGTGRLYGGVVFGVKLGVITTPEISVMINVARLTVNSTLSSSGFTCYPTGIIGIGDHFQLAGASGVLEVDFKTGRMRVEGTLISGDSRLFSSSLEGELITDFQNNFVKFRSREANVSLFGFKTNTSREFFMTKDGLVLDFSTKVTLVENTLSTTIKARGLVSLSPPPTVSGVMTSTITVGQFVFESGGTVFITPNKLVISAQLFGVPCELTFAPGGSGFAPELADGAHLSGIAVPGRFYLSMESEGSIGLEKRITISDQLIIYHGTEGTEQNGWIIPRGEGGTRDKILVVNQGIPDTVAIDALSTTLSFMMFVPDQDSLLAVYSFQGDVRYGEKFYLFLSGRPVLESRLTGKRWELAPVAYFRVVSPGKRTVLVSPPVITRSNDSTAIEWATNRKASARILGGASPDSTPVCVWFSRKAAKTHRVKIKSESKYICLLIQDEDGGYIILGPYDITNIRKVPLSVTDSHASLPSGFLLENTYPNPFSRSTTVSFKLPEAAVVTIKVVDVLGRDVAVLIDDKLQPGRHTTTWNGRTRENKSAPAGAYFLVMEVRLNDTRYRTIRRMALMH